MPPSPGLPRFTCRVIDQSASSRATRHTEVRIQSGWLRIAAICTAPHRQLNADNTFQASIFPQNAMKYQLLAAALSAVFFSFPAFAQLGPAGVPGAPGLAETDPSVKADKPAAVQPAATPSSKVVEQKRTPPKKARVAKKPRPQAACQAQTGMADQRCAPKASLKDQCSSTADPARCELHAKARATCREKQGEAHRQCLRDTLAPRK